MFEIIPTSDVIQIKNVKILIYGDPGAGKTSLANTATLPLTLDFDNGAHRSSYRKDVVRITTWNDIAGNLGKFHEAVKKYNTIVIDTVDTALDYLGAWIISKDEKLARNKLQWYGKLKDEYKVRRTVALYESPAGDVIRRVFIASATSPLASIHDMIPQRITTKNCALLGV